MQQGRAAKDYIVFPLDMPSLKEAKPYIELLAGHIGMFKVGLELFIRSGPEVIELVKKSGSAKVFLDLKLHDIPVTVLRAMESVSELGVAFTTVHCAGASSMLEAAVAGSRGRVGVLGVTVLTSVSGEDVSKAGYREEFSSDISLLVLKRAQAARGAGCAGIVCSGLEAGMIRQHIGGEFVLVTPGIRPAWEGISRDDQKRVTTPAQAIRNGSDYIVIGRPIRDAVDPQAAAGRIVDEIKSVL